jgi:hypothetical protein
LQPLPKAETETETETQRSHTMLWEDNDTQVQDEEFQAEWNIYVHSVLEAIDNGTRTVVRAERY